MFRSAKMLFCFQYYGFRYHPGLGNGRPSVLLASNGVRANFGRLHEHRLLEHLGVRARRGVRVELRNPLTRGGGSIFFH